MKNEGASTTTVTQPKRNHNLEKAKEKQPFYFGQKKKERKNVTLANIYALYNNVAI